MEIELKEKYDHLMKLIIIGDSSVGKSCIMNMYLKNSCKLSVLNLIDQNSQPRPKAYCGGRIWTKVCEDKRPDCQAANMGYSRIREVQVCYKELLPWLNWCHNML